MEIYLMKKILLQLIAINFLYMIVLSLPASAKVSEVSIRYHFPNGGSLAALTAQQVCDVPIEQFLHNRTRDFTEQMKSCGYPVRNLIVLFLAAGFHWENVNNVIRNAESGGDSELERVIRENPDRASLALTMAAAQSSEFVSQHAGNTETDAANADIVSLDCIANMDECEAPTNSENTLQQRNFPVGAYYLGTDEPVFNSNGQIINWSLQQLISAHSQLLRDDYVFVGYHGTSSISARSIVLDGVRAREQALSAIWEGFYIAGDPSVAYGYALNETGHAGAMLRVYVPRSTLNNFFQTDMSLDAPRAQQEIARLIGHMLPLELDSITGPENDDDDEDGRRLETILGWSLAERTVVIPSAIRVDNPGGSLNPSSVPKEEEAISSLPNYATEPR